VLLGLYRSSAETQQVFFSVLDKIADRIFLPHQAAREYLKNRLGVISIRADSYGKIKNESEKLVGFIELIVQEHALPNGKEIVTTAKEAAKEIAGLVEAAANEDPDLLHSDVLLARLAGLFGGKTGQPYDEPTLKTIYADGAQRYARAIPPGYKDDKKGEPDKYGDLLIWLQLIDLAKLRNKSIIFITGDTKEDWWLQHRGETFGPRPELRQEMMVAAGVHFYMYTTPRFLEFAKLFLALQFDTKKAESEFEKIEMQDRQAADQAAGAPYFGTYVAGNTASPMEGLPGWNAAYLDDQANNQKWGWWSTTTHSAVPTQTEPDDSEARNKYFALLPINGHVFRSATGKWKCEIVSYTESGANNRVRYRLKFELEGIIKTPRHLSLWVSIAGLERDPEWRYKKAISGIILDWLDSNQTSGEVAYFA